MIHSIISFKNIPIKKLNGINLPADYKIRPKESNEDIFINTQPKEKKDRFCTSINKGELNNLSRNEFSINLKNKTLENKTMRVFEINNRKKGYGAIMHLNNIIEVLENDLEKIELFSLQEAILFHAKYKFQPKVKNYEDIKDIMFCISQKNCDNFPELKKVTQKAANFFDDMFYTSILNNKNKDIIKESNDIMQEYFDTVNSKKLSISEQEYYALNTSIDMFLTKDRILKNKDFFNKLFEKYNINYKIKDPQ